MTPSGTSINLLLMKKKRKISMVFNSTKENRINQHKNVNEPGILLEILNRYDPLNLLHDLLITETLKFVANVFVFLS